MHARGPRTDGTAAGTNRGTVRRQGPYVWVLAGLIALLLAPLAGLARAEPLPLSLVNAQFQRDTSEPWQTVALPDTWRERGLTVRGDARYRLQITLPYAPVAPWILQFERLPNRHEVRVNGMLVSGLPLAEQEIPRAFVARPMAARLVLSPGVLRTGVNEIEVHAEHGARAGLSTASLGPLDSNAGATPRLPMAERALPVAMNLASAGLGAFMLLAWGFRRSEEALGSFAALGLLASLRNLAYFGPPGTLAPAVADALFIVAQTVTVVLLGHFMMVSADRPSRGYRVALWITAGSSPLVAGLATTLGLAHEVRSVLYVWLLVLVIPGLFLLLRKALEHGSWSERVFAGGLAGVVVVGVHDYLCQQGFTSIMDRYWMPFAIPPLMAVFGALLVRRLVTALDDVEQLARSLDRRVAERTRELDAAHSATRRFLAAASHDLRQPVVSIALLTDMLREQAGDRMSPGLLHKLGTATQALESMLRRLLDLSRLQSDGLRVRFTAVRLSELFRHLNERYAESAHRKGLRLRLRDTPAVVRADPELLDQILHNLLGNAVQYTSTGGVLVAARPTARGHWRIEVRDSGPGIAAAQQQRIFEEFVRLEAGVDHAHGGGLGLGLSIARRAAALLGSTVTVRSRLGHGCCFSLELAAAVAEAAEPASPADSRATLPLRGLTVLLLDDHPGAREALALRIQGWGATVTTVSTLALAIEALEARPGPPHLLVTDLHLPDGLGTRVIALLRRRWPEAAALLLTADTAAPLPDLLAPWGLEDVPVLHKPFGADALLTVVQRALTGTSRPDTDG
jgi:signal transduction histidine kinase